jgi:transcriptional regulator with XRE-family HTH domain
MMLKHSKLAARLRELREQRGNPSQREVAESIGVGGRTYQSWELAQARPSYRNLRALADYYGVSVEYLLEGAIVPDPVADADQLDRIERMCAEIITRLDCLDARTS